MPLSNKLTIIYLVSGFNFCPSLEAPSEAVFLVQFGVYTFCPLYSLLVVRTLKIESIGVTRFIHCVKVLSVSCIYTHHTHTHTHTHTHSHSHTLTHTEECELEDGEQIVELKVKQKQNDSSTKKCFSLDFPPGLVHLDEEGQSTPGQTWTAIKTLLANKKTTKLKQIDY